VEDSDTWLDIVGIGGRETGLQKKEDWSMEKDKRKIMNI